MLGSSLSGLLPTERGPTPFDGVAYFSWSLTEGLARAWSASCGHFQPVYYDRQCGMWHLCPLLSFFWIFHFDDLTRKELNGVISAVERCQCVQWACAGSLKRYTWVASESEP